MGSPCGELLEPGADAGDDVDPVVEGFAPSSASVNGR